MKNIEVLVAQEALAVLSKEKMPVAPAGIKVRRLTRQISEAAGDINDARMKLLEAHAKRKAPTDEQKAAGQSGRHFCPCKHGCRRRSRYRPKSWRYSASRS